MIPEAQAPSFDPWEHFRTVRNHMSWETAMIIDAVLAIHAEVNEIRKILEDGL